MLLWLWGGSLVASCGGRSSKSDEAGSANAGSPAGGSGTAGTPAAGGRGGDKSGGKGGDKGGEPNAEPCILGEACSVEGQECTDDSGCCVIRDVCRDGHWIQSEYLGPCKNDPPAPAFQCPSVPPVEGTACGVCPDECRYDLCSPEGGQDLIVQCVEGKWNHVDLGCLACCASDADCAGGICTRSRCEFYVGPGCFRDSECPQGQICGGAQIAECGTARAWDDQPGVCVPANLDCCATNDDCQANEVCLAGVCKPPAPADRCWTNSDCGLIGCGQPTVCPCGSSCKVPDAPATCLVAL